MGIILTAQVFATEHETVVGGTDADAGPFLAEVLARSTSVARTRLRPARDGSLTCRWKPTLLAPRVRLTVTAEATRRDGQDLLALRWWAQVCALPGAGALEGDLVNGAGARHAVGGRAGQVNDEVLEAFDRVAFQPAVDALRALRARPVR